MSLKCLACMQQIILHETNQKCCFAFVVVVRCYFVAILVCCFILVWLIVIKYREDWVIGECFWTGQFLCMYVCAYRSARQSKCNAVHSRCDLIDMARESFISLYLHTHIARRKCYTNTPVHWVKNHFSGCN